MSEPIFGTDGIRGRAGEGWLSTDAVAHIGWAVGSVLADGGGTAILGHDGRRSGPELEVAFARGLAAAGIDARSAGLITTPGLAWLARTRGFRLGAMLSASHNPAEDNGIKVFSSGGEKLSDADQAAIERLLREDPPELPEGTGAAHDPAFEKEYLEHLLAAAGDLELDGTPIALDCANGGGSRVAPKVFGRLGAQVHSFASEPDGENINKGCGSTEPETLQNEVHARGAHIGVALDGDGDRCILVDEKSEIVNGDGIMTVLARHAAGRWSDPRIVATVMSNRGLHRALREAGVGVVEVGVGDRAVVERLRDEGLELGGEQSGHIVFADNACIGDGIVTTLRVLRVMQETGLPLSELAAPYRPLPQVLLNVPVTRKPSLADLPDVLDLVRRVESDLGEDGRVLLRYSGTEDLARVMVEGPDPDVIQGHADEIAARIAESIGVPVAR